MTRHRCCLGALAWLLFGFEQCDAVEFKPVTHLGKQSLACFVDLGKEQLELFWKDESGAQYYKYPLGPIIGITEKRSSTPTAQPGAR